MFFAPSKSRKRAKIWIMVVPKASDKPVASSETPNQDYRTWMLFAPSKSRKRAKIWIMGVSKTSDHIHIMIKMPYPSQEPPSSSKAPNEDLKDMMFFAPLKSR